MKRFIDDYLLEWKHDEYRRALLLRGARQVGKTYAVRQLGKTFETYLELNLELEPEYRDLFEKNLDPHRIVTELSFRFKKDIVPGKTLLFFDEVQMVPRAITALRYFYEKMPELHVIAAGSLIDFAIKHVGVPVGRVQFLYMYPLSFLEFLDAGGYGSIIDAIKKHSAHDEPFLPVTHEKLLSLVGEYIALGGMPAVVWHWQQEQDLERCFAVQQSIINSYRQDFEKYADRYQLKYVRALFDAVPRQMGNKFKYSIVEGEFRKRELAPCLDLLETAGVAHSVVHSSAQGIPLGAQVNFDIFKVIPLDIGLAQAILGVDVRSWFIDPTRDFVNKGEVVEAFVGQELLAYADPRNETKLYYWQKSGRAISAEVDYVIPIGSKAIPVEVKSGPGTALKSMRSFLESHPNSPYGIRFSTQNYSLHEMIHSYPLYAIVRAAFSNR